MRNKDDKLAWAAKMKTQPNLIWVDLNELKSQEKLGELWKMVQNDYALSLEDIMRHLRCSRAWATENMLPYTKHIFINYYTRKAMVAYAQKNIKNFNFFLPNGYYFFSKSSYNNWLCQSIVADKQTIQVDLRSYAPPGILEKAVKKELAACQSIEGMNNLSNALRVAVENVLSSDGKALYDARLRPNARQGTPRLIISALPPAKFVTIGQMRNTHKNNERVMRHLFAVGATRYTIADSLVRYDMEDAKKSISPYSICVPVKRD